jgi:hypothetical protein
VEHIGCPTSSEKYLKFLYLNFFKSTLYDFFSLYYPYKPWGHLKHVD